MRFLQENKIILLLIVLLILSLYFNLSMFKKMRYYYISMNAIKLDPLDFDRYQSYRQEYIPANAIDTKKKTVVIFGDSRAEAWPDPQSDNFQFINRAISGQTSAQAWLRFDEHVSYLQPKVIVVQVGGNDLRMLPLPPQQRKDIVRNCQENIRKITQSSQDIGATVILTTIFPLAQANLSLQDRWLWPNLNDIDRDIEEVNAYIRSLEAENVIIFDAYSILQEKGKTNAEYAQDLLHINSAGYQALNQKLIEILAELK